MSNRNWRFKRAIVDQKNGDIELYFINEEGHGYLIRTNKNLESHIFDDLPKGLDEKEVQERIKVLIEKA